MVLVKCPACGGTGKRMWNLAVACGHEFGGAYKEIPDESVEKMLHEGDWREKMWANAAVATIAENGGEARHLVAGVITNFEDRDFAVRGAAVRVAAQLRRCVSVEDAMLMETGVIKTFADAYFGVRAVACHTAVEFRRCGSSKGEELQNLVVRACSDGDPEVRAAAVTAIAEMRREGFGSADLEAAVKRLLEDTSNTARSAAQAAWAVFGNSLEEVGGQKEAK